MADNDGLWVKIEASVDYVRYEEIGSRDLTPVAFRHFDAHVQAWHRWLGEQRGALRADIWRALRACYPDRCEEQIAALERWLHDANRG